jgi:DNA polymerase III delta prime subunit
MPRVLKSLTKYKKIQMNKLRKLKLQKEKATAAALRTQKAIEVASRYQQQADTVLQKVAARQVASKEQVQKVMERQPRKNILNILKVQKLATKSLAKKPRKRVYQYLSLQMVLQCLFVVLCWKRGLHQQCEAGW